MVMPKQSHTLRQGGRSRDHLLEPPGFQIHPLFAAFLLERLFLFGTHSFSLSWMRWPRINPRRCRSARSLRGFTQYLLNSWGSVNFGQFPNFLQGTSKPGSSEEVASFFKRHSHNRRINPLFRFPYPLTYHIM